MEKLSYKLQTFEGPLDLLLYLITKNKLNIYDIQISELLDQYMEHINAMRDMDMDIQSEFLEMAAQLVYMKTVSLLPKHEEADELKRELTGRLLEYQECRVMAAKLAEEMNFDSYVRTPAEIDFDQTYRRKHNPNELLAAYLSAAGRGRRKLPPPAEAFSGIVSRRVVSVASRIIHVLRRLWKTKEMDYASLFKEQTDKSDLVATFLAVLELVKGKRVRIEDEGSKTMLKLTDGGKGWKSSNFRQP